MDIYNMDGLNIYNTFMITIHILNHNGWFRVIHILGNPHITDGKFYVFSPWIMIVIIAKAMPYGRLCFGQMMIHQGMK